MNGEKPIDSDELVALGSARYANRKHLGEHTAASLEYEPLPPDAVVRRRFMRVDTDASREAADRLVKAHAPPSANDEDWQPVTLDDTDIPASAAAAERGESPGAVFRESIKRDMPTVDMPAVNRVETRPTAGYGQGLYGVGDYGGSPATILRGEQHDAHVALQAAAKTLKDAQAKAAEAQVVFRSALEAWCKASEAP